MPTLLRLVRFVSWSLAFCLILAGPVLAVASPRSFQEEPSPSPSTEPTPSDPVSVYELEVTVVAEPEQVRQGEDIVFSITVKNPGIVSARGVTLRNQIPTFLEVNGIENPDNAEIPPYQNEVVAEYDTLAAGDEVSIKILTRANGISAPDDDEANAFTATITAEGEPVNPDNDVAKVIVTVMPDPTATPTPTSPTEPTPTMPAYPGPGEPTATPTATSVPSLPSPTPTTPGSSPPPAGTSTPTPTDDPSAPLPTATPVLDPVASPSDGALLDLSVRVAPNPAQVDDILIIEATVTNVGTTAAATARLEDKLPLFLEAFDLRATREPMHVQYDNNVLTVSYEYLAPGESITTQIFVYALSTSGSDGDPLNVNTLHASVDKRSEADATVHTQIIVEPATQTGSGQPSQPGTTPGGGTTDPTPTPVPPSKLPDTGAPNDGMLLVVAAGGLLIAGAGAHLMLRRRSARL